MAETAANIDRSEAQAIEAVEAYRRLREQARRLNERAGWDADEFDQEVPAADFAEAKRGEDARARDHRHTNRNGPRAQFLLRQLAAWATGYAEAFEIETRLEAEAEAKLRAAEPKRGPAGFNPS